MTTCLARASAARIDEATLRLARQRCLGSSGRLSRPGEVACIGIVAESITRAGFRGWAFASPASRWLAGFEVAGYVRNLPDGRVELVAEGDPARLDDFLDVDPARDGPLHQRRRDRVRYRTRRLPWPDSRFVIKRCNPDVRSADDRESVGSRPDPAIVHVLSVIHHEDQSNDNHEITHHCSRDRQRGDPPAGVLRDGVLRRRAC